MPEMESNPDHDDTDADRRRGAALEDEFDVEQQDDEGFDEMEEEMRLISSVLDRLLPPERPQPSTSGLQTGQPQPSTSGQPQPSTSGQPAIPVDLPAPMELDEVSPHKNRRIMKLFVFDIKIAHRSSLHV